MRVLAVEIRHGYCPPAPAPSHSARFLNGGRGWKWGPVHTPGGPLPPGTIQDFLGGRREWFKCPDCGDRARILYGPDFACRSCQQLNYPSTRRCSRDRAITRSVQMRRRLGGDGSLLEPFPRRPKGMKRKTWWRLFAKASRDEQRGIAEMAEALRCKSVHLT